MGEHLTFENMELNFEYECLKNRPVFAKQLCYLSSERWWYK